MSAVLGVQVPLLMVHRRTYVVYEFAVKVDVPEVDELNVPVPPLTMLHAPVPFNGVLPPSEPLVKVPQRFCVAPMVAVVGVAELVIVTVLSDGVQLPLLIVHLNTYTPGITLVTVVLYNVALVIAGVFGPLTRVHNPAAGDGLFPARVIVTWLHWFCAGPAFDATGVLL